MDIKTILKDFSDEFCKTIWENTQSMGVSGVGYTGSYARGDYSKSRPDINFAVFVHKPTPQLLLKIGDIASSLNVNYSTKVNLRPEHHPDRFLTPWGRDGNKPDLFFKIGLFDTSQMNPEFPFGRPGYVVEAHKISAKILYGQNEFENLKITSSNEQVMRGVRFVLPNWLKQIQLTPLSYNLERDTDLFFNEAMVWGKLAIQQYAWVQGIKNGLDYSRREDRLAIFNVIHDKERLRKFINVDGEQQKMINIVLDSRLNYLQWKNDRAKANAVYMSSHHLLTHFVGELNI